MVQVHRTESGLGNSVRIPVRSCSVVNELVCTWQSHVALQVVKLLVIYTLKRLASAVQLRPWPPYFSKHIAVSSGNSRPTIQPTIRNFDPDFSLNLTSLPKGARSSWTNEALVVAVVSKTKQAEARRSKANGGFRRFLPSRSKRRAHEKLEILIFLYFRVRIFL